MPPHDHNARMLLPEGSGRLRADLGAFLKRRRQGKLDDQTFGTQAQLAARVGIRRQALSEIERGKNWPGPATLDSLLDILDLGWEHVAHPVASERAYRNCIDDMPGGGRLTEIAPILAPARSRRCTEGKVGLRIIAFGKAIKAARRGRGLSLVQSASEAGISAALLSRLERGQISRSRVFRFDAPTDGSDWPVLVILNPWLELLHNGT